MKFRIYILLAAAMLWFTFAFVFMYRATWDLKDAKHYKNALIEYGIQRQYNTNRSNIFVFKLQGLEDSLGIYRKKLMNYDYFLNSMHIGDTISVYYEDWKQAKGTLNLQIVHLENNGKVLINYKDRKNRDLTVAVILYTICMLFLVAAWILNRKRLKNMRQNGIYIYGPGILMME